MAKLKIPTPEKATSYVKSTISSIIKNMSVIAIFLSLGVMALLYLGPEIHIATRLVFGLAVPSVVLAISITVINELWLKNGQQTAHREPQYQHLLGTYDTKSTGLHYPALQKFLDYERNRRYEVEKNRLDRLLEREQSILSKLEQTPENTKSFKRQVKIAKHRIRKYHIALDNIKITLPFEKAEEFDYLRYNLKDILYKEYTPYDTQRHLNRSRRRKYTSVSTFSIVGLNIMSIGGSFGNVWIAIIMTSLSAVALLFTVISGFSAGYHNISVISTGIYNTGNSFLDQAVAYCKREGIDLYYKGATEFREYVEPVLVETVTKTEAETKPAELDIFAKAAKEVSKNYN